MADASRGKHGMGVLLAIARDQMGGFGKKSDIAPGSKDIMRRRFHDM